MITLLWIITHITNRKILRACGLNTLPDRRTFDRRLSTISIDIKEMIVVMANLFVKEKLVDPYIIAIDSTLLKAKGHVCMAQIIYNQGSSTSFRYRY